MKNTFAIIFILIANCTFAQKIELKGKVISEDKKPVEAATVYLSSQKDSTLIDYTITDTQGFFSMPLRAMETPTFVTVSYIGFEDFSKKLDQIKTSIDLGVVELFAGSAILDELVITTDAVPIRVKQDTLEFNAASFKVRPDATVKELLEQLPGVEVDEEGKIKVNGKEVTNVLVNGKPFFSEDGKVIMENLPAEIINKVQVTDYKTKEEKLAGAVATGETQTINLTIDEDKNKGLFGQAIAGYGTNDRYESSLLFNYFKGDLKVSVLGASNNINSTGFSTDEIMDNMSGGRNRYSSWSGDGSFSINGLEFGGGQGIYQTDMLGFNYSDNWGKKTEVSGNYLFHEVESNNKNKSRIENLLPDNRYITESESDTKSKSGKHSFNYDIEVKLDSLTTFSITPKLQKGINTSRSNSFRATRNEFNELLNESENNNYTQEDSYFFQNQLLVSRRFHKKGRSLSVTFDNKNTKTSSDDYRNSSARFYQTQMPDDVRDQQVLNNNHIDEYAIGFFYREPISDKQTVSLNFKNTWTNDFQRRGTFDRNNASDMFSDYNNLLSFSNHLNGIRTHSSVSYQVRGEKITLSTNVGSTFNNYDIASLYNDQNYLNQRLDVLPNLSSFASIRFGKSTRLSVNYSYREESPSFHQLLEYEDLSNPLFITSGDKNLKTTQRHSVYLNFSNYDWQTRSGYYFYGGGSINPRTIASATLFDDNYVGYSTYVNVENTNNYWLGLNYSKSYQMSDKNKMTIAGELSFNGGSTKGFQNNVAFINNYTLWGPGASLTFDFDKKLIIKPSYEYTITHNSFKNSFLDKSNYFVHNAGLMITSYWPKNVVFGSDMTYQYNSNLADGFKKDYLLWNMSLGYSFHNERLIAKVKVYDLLNQNQSIRRSVSATSISDVENTILKQYFMFSLTYKLEKFAGKKKKNNDFIVM
ncbi:MAG TPA: TonB-dependent receptor [Flavobacterium sp.]|nr:TonB-dependent receptor [Flavobacterium sp.]